ncbi:hypothetical protein SAMN05216464_101791 [Mucilaginibacter pineti]|uniref:Uncharacterized protein n=1 Tax=Mucilaginibacter pineti TaxID=1391627 RepID=A0A1G6UXE0_9SPHI|nr:hypothetical protein SAMN05216464_101791 [Mucilaginibacter pineti]
MYKFNWFEKSLIPVERKSRWFIVQMTAIKQKTACPNHYTFGSNCYFIAAKQEFNLLNRCVFNIYYLILLLPTYQPIKARL